MRGKVKRSAMTGHIERKTENQVVFGAYNVRTAPILASFVWPSSIRTIPSAPEFHRIVRCRSAHRGKPWRSWALPPVGTYAVSVHPAPKVVLFNLGYYNFYRWKGQM